MSVFEADYCMQYTVYTCTLISIKLINQEKLGSFQVIPLCKIKSKTNINKNQRNKISDGHHQNEMTRNNKGWVKYGQVVKRNVKWTDGKIQYYKHYR